ncbi:anaerobic glycerol-3-phosphate dehydrogenase subunit C [Anaeroselena agilis]|uniref:Anaerobic glycerol-3-phosphate dehydrogenase subunit C n=1 Tax=Anaeroselena agilis TaxID=3063788 RepID=A0ABU3P2Z6_9FIRM|nr:anaerobic glycerol-3-phosphate dehydrogenase subunit C [Selenomonadales bacterium 4137-cl]
MKKCNTNLDACTACASCTALCPVAAVVRDFPGPKLAGPAAERHRLAGAPADAALAYCTNCKTCDITCPSGVPVAALNMRARAGHVKKHGRRLRDWILAHGEHMAKLAMPAQPLSNLGMANPVTRRMLKAIGIAGSRPLPRYAPRTFLRSFGKLRQQPYDDKVVFFPGCFINYNDPQVGLDLIAVLQANRYEVLVPPGLACCGVPLVTGGYLEEGGKAARRNLAVLADHVRRGVPVLTACTSCGLMLKQEYGELFGADGAGEVAARTYDVMEFLLELHDQGRLNTAFTPVGGKYLYHAPCHLRAQGIGRPALELLAALPGVAVTDLDAGCCGIAGSYGFKDDRYDISMAIGRELFAKIKAAPADAVLADCGTCRLQIAHGAGVKALHPIAVVRKAYEPGYKL